MDWTPSKTLEKTRKTDVERYAKRYALKQAANRDYQNRIRKYVPATVCRTCICNATA